MKKCASNMNVRQKLNGLKGFVYPIQFTGSGGNTRVVVRMLRRPSPARPSPTTMSLRSI